jgi:hypothetical protein
MTWPTVAVGTTNVDAGTDSPASARTDIKDAMDKLNQMMAHVTAFAATLLDDANAATFRSTLGAAASGANTDITSLASPALGGATATTQTAGDNTTKVATTAFVIGQAATLAPAALGTAAVGASLKYAREDHVHTVRLVRLQTRPLATLAATGWGSPPQAHQSTPPTQRRAFTRQSGQLAYTHKARPFRLAPGAAFLPTASTAAGRSIPPACSFAFLED